MDLEKLAVLKEKLDSVHQIDSTAVVTRHKLYELGKELNKTETKLTHLIKAQASLEIRLSTLEKQNRIPFSKSVKQTPCARVDVDNLPKVSLCKDNSRIS